MIFISYYYSLSKYLKENYHEKLYKLSLACSDDCPNRKNKKDGCIFCSNLGSGNFALSSNINIKEQIEHAKNLVNNKAKCNRYIAYFQAFTSTYCDYEKTSKTFEYVINRDDIAILSIATRPDCIDLQWLNLFEKLNKIKPVWVELGLQTIHDNTAILINRGYKTNVYFNAVKKLKSIGVNVITHIIIGLPNETEEMIYETVKSIGAYTDGIKLQLLHVLKGTALEKMYNEGKVEILTIENYTKILSGCIERIKKDVVIHRLTGDGDKKELIAPLWSGNKKYVLNYINKYFDKNDIIQGKLANN